jgi:hypothetical protein
MNDVSFEDYSYQPDPEIGKLADDLAETLRGQGFFAYTEVPCVGGPTVGYSQGRMDVWAIKPKYGERYTCNPGEAPVWMADMAFRPLGDLRVGDQVVGWEAPDASRRRLCIATVTALHRRAAPVVRVTMESGRSFRCTSDHWWLSYWGDRSTSSVGLRVARRGYSGSYRVGRETFVHAEPGRILSHVIDPTERIDDRLGGWLGGLYDGEGSGAGITQSEEHNPSVVARLREVMGALGIAYTERLHKRHEGMLYFALVGGRQAYVDFVNKARPVRVDALKRLILSGRFRRPDCVVDVTPERKLDEVFSLTTTTGNYVAWGYASKNCAYEVKISRSDFLADVNRDKFEKYVPYARRFYFAVPQGLVKKAEVPAHVGLVVRGPNGWRHLRHPPPNSDYEPPIDFMLMILRRGLEEKRQVRDLQLRATWEANYPLSMQAHRLGHEIGRKLAAYEDGTVVEEDREEREKRYAALALYEHVRRLLPTLGIDEERWSTSTIEHRAEFIAAMMQHAVRLQKLGRAISQLPHQAAADLDALLSRG